MYRPFLILGLGVVGAALLILASATVWYERPTQLTVAISSGDTVDFPLNGAAVTPCGFTSSPSKGPWRPPRRSTTDKPISP